VGHFDGNAANQSRATRRFLDPQTPKSRRTAAAWPFCICGVVIRFEIAGRAEHGGPVTQFWLAQRPENDRLIALSRGSVPDSTG